MKKILIGFFLSIFLFVPVAGAEDLNDAVSAVLQNDNRLKASESDVYAAKQREKAAYALYFPTFELDSQYGKTHHNWQNTHGFSLSAYRTNARLVQLLFDFGATQANFQNANFVYFKEIATEEFVRQEITLDALTAFYKLKQAEQLVKYANQSMENIKEQTSMENARIKKGRGYSTDALQAKAQLLKAKAALVKAGGSLQGARNRAERIFNRSADEVSGLTEAGLFTSSDIPSSLEEAEKTALQYNPELKAAEFAIKVAEQGKRYTKSTAYPELNGVLESDWRNDIGGIDARRRDYSAKLELSWDFNLGLSSVRQTRAASAEITAAKERKLDTKKKVLEQVRNAWQNIKTAGENALILRSQEDIAEEFLKLARKERKHGRRTLLDVLNGETTLIEAKSEAASAEADVTIHTYSLLRTIGKLVKSDS
ncbi:MAG: TolC family protein [Desulfobacteraceae bacterium]|nr:TolC family protein [Desulfobacteraceae bacterium]